MTTRQTAHGIGSKEERKREQRETTVREAMTRDRAQSEKGTGSNSKRIYVLGTTGSERRIDLIMARAMGMHSNSGAKDAIVGKINNKTGSRQGGGVKERQKLDNRTEIDKSEVTELVKLNVKNAEIINTKRT